MSEDNQTTYSFKKEDEFTCVSCECIPEMHISGWKCPIFDNETICSECCLVETLQSDVDVKFSTKLGKTITKEEINKICKDCGRNNATQDVKLSPALLNQQKPDINNK